MKASVNSQWYAVLIFLLGGALSEQTAAKEIPASDMTPKAESVSNNPFQTSNILVIHGRLKSFVRTLPLNRMVNGKNIESITVSNSCGYDTALLEVREVLLGTYDAKELAAYQTLSEWCEGAWQPSAHDYFLVLHWEDNVWKVDRSFSSPLLQTNGREFWVVEPVVLRRLIELGVSQSEPLTIAESLRVRLTNERLEQIDVHPINGVSPKAAAEEAVRSCKGKDLCWSGAPMLFTHGIRLSELRKFLASQPNR